MIWFALRRIRSHQPARRIAAIRKLATSIDERAFPALRLTVQDRDSSVRIEAIRAIADYGHDNTLAVLACAAVDGDSAVAGTAIALLSKRTNWREELLSL